MALTELQVKNAKAVDKPLKLSDGGGLFLLVQPDSEKINERKKSDCARREVLAAGLSLRW